MPRILICSLALLLPLQVLAAERKGSGDRHEQAERGGSSGKKGSGKGGNKPSQPSKPAQPSQPAKPAQPSQPARPAQPSQPAKPAQPSQPARPAEPSRPAEPRPADSRPGDSRPSDSRPSDSRPSDSRPSDSRPSDARPADNGPSDARPSDSRPSDARPVDNRPSDSRPADSRPDDARPSGEPVRANPRPVDDRAEDRGGRDGGQDDRGGRQNVTASPRPAQGPARSAPVVQRVQVGQPASMANAAPQNRRSAAPAPANFRSSSVQAVSRSRGSNAAPATRVMAQHRAQTARQVAASAAAHRRAAVVRHHHAAHAHHQAWARHHYSVWRPHRYYVYPRPYPYWYDPWYYGRPVRWYHGVFVYGPPVVHHHYYTDSTPEDVPEQAEAPKRKVDRSHTFAVGIRGGSYLSSYSNGASYGDAGLGLALRYRPVEALGFEAQWTYHDQSWSRGSERVQQPFSLSAELFAMPWSRFNPYVLAGVTYTGRNINDPQGRSGTVETEQALWGPHGGIGLELGVGDRASVNFDLRGIGYVNKPDNDISRPGAVQANMGVNFYF